MSNMVADRVIIAKFWVKNVNTLFVVIVLGCEIAM